MKYLIIASKQDKAGRNIATCLMDLNGDYKFHLVNGEVTITDNLDLYRISQFDFIIFTSKHKSEKKQKTLSIHAPGNFKEVWGSGEAGKLCPTSALFQKALFENINKEVKSSELTKYKLTLECTHHGPLINKPCIFVEIGGSEEEWKDRRAAFCLAKAIRNTIENFKPNPYNEIAIGIGGPHYCPGFNKIQLNSNIALSHIIPSYAQPITADFIKEALHKTVEEVDFAVLDWKGLGKSEERQKIINLLEENYISWKKTSEIKK